jgi:hypothetical protein
MQHNSSVGGAAHPAIADTHHVAYALLEQFLRQWHVGDFWHPGVALGPAPAQHQNCLRTHIELRIVDAVVEVLDAVENQSASAVLDEVRGGSCGFDDGAGWSQVAAQHGDTAFGQQRMISKPDHLWVPNGSGEVAAGDGLEARGDQRHQTGRRTKPELRRLRARQRLRREPGPFFWLAQSRCT